MNRIIKETAVSALLVSTYDLKGGAGKATFRLHKSLLAAGQQSKMLVASKESDALEDVVQLKPQQDLLSRIGRKSRALYLHAAFSAYRNSRPEGMEMFSDVRFGTSENILLDHSSFDVVNLHWIANFIQLSKVFRELSGKLPLVFTLHDMNMLTGGCHYTMGCEKYLTRCKQCPQLGSSRRNDLAEIGFQTKSSLAEHIKADACVFVTPSRWLADEASRSKILNGARIEVIRNGIDLQIFKPRDRQLARKFFGIPDETFVLLFVSDQTSNHRKGLDLLSGAIEKIIHNKNLLILTVGSGAPRGIPDEKLMHLGPIHSERIMSFIYSAANLFVAPSRQDNLPNTIIESMACGTPVVAFAVGGIPEMIEHQIDGFLVDNISSSGLADVINQVSDPASYSDLHSLGKTAREKVRTHYSNELCAANYLSLFRRLKR